MINQIRMILGITSETYLHTTCTNSK